jgi:hypothetical protein
VLYHPIRTFSINQAAGSFVKKGLYTRLFIVENNSFDAKYVLFMAHRWIRHWSLCSQRGYSFLAGKHKGEATDYLRQLLMTWVPIIVN